jgi:hypothetical protein
MTQTNTVMLTISIALGVTGLMIIAAIGNAQALSKSSERWCVKFENGGKEYTQCYPDFFICRENEGHISQTPRTNILESCHKVS